MRGDDHLIEGHSIVYQCHELSGIDGPVNPAHHAMLRLPPREHAGTLSFSAFVLAQTAPNDAFSGGATRSFLADHTVITDLTRVPCRDGTTTDVTRYPARRGFDDAAILCADPGLRFAWSAVTLPEEGYLWFALRSPRLLPTTLLWFSNGGTSAAPWNGRHCDVLGMEDTLAYFGYGLAASAQSNELNAAGVPTCVVMAREATLRIPYIQGVAWIPREFDFVAAIEGRDDELLIQSDSGAIVRVDCQLDFIGDGRIRASIDM